jgi:hypothetical protein
MTDLRQQSFEKSVSGSLDSALQRVRRSRKDRSQLFEARAALEIALARVEDRIRETTPERITQ